VGVFSASPPPLPNRAPPPPGRQGVNATCVNITSGAEYPANCPHDSSHCYCPDAPYPEAQQWVATMETSLQAQCTSRRRCAVKPVVPRGPVALASGCPPHAPVYDLCAGCSCPAFVDYCVLRTRAP
jgi:hypothetical protein